MAEFAARCRLASSLPPDFGDGWLTASARDWVRIALFAGFDRAQLVGCLVRAGTPGRMTNAATVRRIMSELAKEQR